GSHGDGGGNGGGGNQRRDLPATALFHQMAVRGVNPHFKKHPQTSRLSASPLGPSSQTPCRPSLQTPPAFYDPSQAGIGRTPLRIANQGRASGFFRNPP